mgnify:FL=1
MVIRKGKKVIRQQYKNNNIISNNRYQMYFSSCFRGPLNRSTYINYLLIMPRSNNCVPFYIIIIIVLCTQGIRVHPPCSNLLLITFKNGLLSLFTLVTLNMVSPPLLLANAINWVVLPLHWSTVCALLTLQWNTIYFIAAQDPSSWLLLMPQCIFLVCVLYYLSEKHIVLPCVYGSSDKQYTQGKCTLEHT